MIDGISRRVPAFNQDERREQCRPALTEGTVHEHRSAGLEEFRHEPDESSQSLRILHPSVVAHRQMHAELPRRQKVFEGLLVRVVRGDERCAPGAFRGDQGSAAPRLTSDPPSISSAA
jgi:hypothetical protein